MTICYIFIMEYYSALRINETIKFAGQRMELENIIISEIIQSQEA